MQNLSRRILIEFLWVALSLSSTILIAVFLFGLPFLKGELSSWLPLTLLFFAVTFIVSLIKAFKKESITTHLI